MSYKKLWLIIGVVAVAFITGLLVAVSRREGDVPADTITPTHSSDSASPPPKNAKPSSEMIVHKNIIATMFWVGEAASADNDYIQNRSSAWQGDWLGYYGGEDKPDDRCGYKPCAFMPKENPFYFALPFNDRKENGQAKPASVLRKIPWYTGQPQPGKSLVKNRWVEITHEDIRAYAQWEDAGPSGEDDVGYVFGTSEPKESRAGIDLSPATANYLRINGRGKVSWKFVEAVHVPAGPWKEIITDSDIQY